MKPKIILCLAFVAFNLSLQARAVRLWTDAELMATSDLVAVGRPIKVKDLDESNSLGWDKSIGWSQLTFRGVETTFKISEILKGALASDQIVLHHYRFDKVNPPNGPTFVEFTPGDTDEYLLYLINDGTNRYAPTSGQIDARLQIKPTMTNNIGVTPQADAVAKVKLKFAKADSEETNSENGYGKNAVDGNPNTFWDTQWHGNSPGLPHEIIIELVPPSVIKGFTCLPRQDESDHGTIKDYEFYVSTDGKNFGQPVKKGAFEPGKEEKIETFEPVKCCFVKLKAISEINGQPWTSAAEIGVIQSGEDISAMTNPIIQTDNLLAEFEKTKSADQLEAAYVAVGNIPEPGVDKTVPAVAARREKTIMLFKLLAVIDQNIDTNFDVNNSSNWPVVNMYYPGVELKLTKDPVYRATFEAAVKRNDENIARLNFQTRLHNIDQSGNIFVKSFLQHSYTTSKEDQSELENLMKQAKLSPDRVQSIKALFESTNLDVNDVDTNLTKQIPKKLPLDFLADMPFLKDVSLKISEAELLDILHQKKLNYTHKIDHGDSIYYVHPNEHAIIIITFRRGHCGGIQRMMD
ncbi:MAG TPA: discoidin domain-containing protein [Verrucomicrobiae bacterium]|jgi:hypothetical protein